MAIYTRKGDAGQASLNPYATKISKASSQIEALGTIDELTSLLGFCRSISRVPEISKALGNAQHVLFRIQAHLAKDPQVKIELPLVTAEHVQDLENLCDSLEKKLPPLTKFIMSGSPLGALIQYARAISRRAERRVVKFQEETNTLPSEILQYLNRLSSALFMLARLADQASGAKEEFPDYYKPQEQDNTRIR